MKLDQSYIEAAKIDSLINEVINNYGPITEKNAKSFMIFARTIKTGLTLIEEVSKDLLLKGV